MARDWETWLKNSTGPASATEEDDRDRTEARIRKAVLEDSRLAGNVSIFVQGSYATGTNVRRNSDVDIAVEWKDWAYIDKFFDAEKFTWAELGVTTTSRGPTPNEYRRWVTEALETAFGSTPVTAGNKAIRVDGGSTTLDADVVPCFRYFRYDAPRQIPSQGIEIHPRDGSGKIVNWPHHNADNSNAKNRATGRRHKQLGRAFKRLENDMLEIGRLSEPVPGYLIQCLLFNCPDIRFTDVTYKDTALSLLSFLWSGLRDDSHEKWAEVNNLKYLFTALHRWTPADAFTFVDRAYDYIDEG